MLTFLLILIILSWIVFIFSVLLMTPKGGLGFGVWWITTSNEYGSKKSLETTLKKSAIVSILVFTVSSMIYPYLNRKNFNNIQNVKIETTNSKAQNKKLPQLKINSVKTVKKEKVDNTQNNNTKQTNSSQTTGTNK